MYLVLGYAIFAVFCALFLLAFFLLERCLFNREKKKIENYKETILLHVQLAENAVLVEQLENSKSKRLDKYPHIRKYLSQNTALVGYYFSLESVEFCKSRKNIEGWDFDAFLKEYMSCSDPKIHLALRNTVNIIDSLYKNKHPVLYKIQTFKKNLLVHILSVVLAIVIWMKEKKTIYSIQDEPVLKSSIRDSMSCRISMKPDVSSVALT